MLGVVPKFSRTPGSIGDVGPSLGEHTHLHLHLTVTSVRPGTVPGGHSRVGTLRSMEWTVHGERSVYESEWMSLSLVDVELPSGKRFEHHVLRMPCDAAGVVVDDPERGVLLLWRHRFISDTWGWEVPGRACRSR